MRKNFTAADYVAFFVLGCVAAIAALYLAFGWAKLGAFWGDASTAAWVQAIGSIGAILATGWAVHRAHQLQIAQRRQDVADDYTRFLEFAHQIVSSAAKSISRIADFESTGRAGPTDRRTMVADLAVYSHAFDRLDIARLQGMSVIHAVLSASAATRKLLTDLELNLDPKLAPHMRQQVRESADFVLPMMQAHEETLAIALRDRRGVARSDTLTL